LRGNPDLAKQMAAAAASQAGPGFGNFMGMAMGVQPPAPSFPGNGGGMPPMPSMPMSDAGAFMGASSAPPASPPPMNMPSFSSGGGGVGVATARREMKGPTGVDDILKTFEEVRRAEAMGATIPQPATGYSSQPAVAGVMSGAASVISADEMMSTATGMTGGGGKRKRRTAAPPVGNTFSLNV